MIAFIDLQAQQKYLGNSINDAIARVLNHGVFIGGEEVERLELMLASRARVANCISCANGTDALELIMIAEEVGPGDAVFVPSFTFVASGEVVPRTGAKLVLVDVQPDTFVIDPNSLKLAVEDARRAGLHPKIVIAVDLFGLPADYNALAAVARKEGMLLVADAAQSFGGEYNGQPVGCLADYTTTSFFPAKPLGCYGDGGAIFTERADKAEIIRSLCVHGKGTSKYDNVRIGKNSRLDTIQAAILIEKLSIFEEEIEKRRKVAEFYNEVLQDDVSVPVNPNNRKSAWAQYTIKIRNRDVIQKECAELNIPTVVYYNKPLHLQVGYNEALCPRRGLGVSELLATKVLSLPMHPYLTHEDQICIANVLKRAVKNNN